MTLLRSSERAPHSGRVVAVISSADDLRRALRLRSLPDLFELRLDALICCLDDIQRSLKKLRTALIITARHPLEGGVNNLKPQQRAALLLRFLDDAAYIDVELRSVAQMHALLDEGRKAGVGVILSTHELRTTPSFARMQQLAHAAEEHRADIFKLASRTDTPAQLARLMQFVDEPRSPMPISVMGIGRLGAESRIAFLRKGSALNYGHLGDTHVDGQLSLDTLRRHRARESAPGAIFQRQQCV